MVSVADAATGGDFSTTYPQQLKMEATLPISYAIEAGARSILETWTGDVSASDLASFWTALLADPEVMDIRRTLVDLRECRITFTGKELSHLINTIVMPALDGRDWTSAILVSDPVQYGVSRQYNVFAEVFSNDAIFEDLDAARAWLERQ